MPNYRKAQGKCGCQCRCGDCQKQVFNNRRRYSINAMSTVELSDEELKLQLVVSIRTAWGLVLAQQVQQVGNDAPMHPTRASPCIQGLIAPITLKHINQPSMARLSAVLLTKETADRCYDSWTDPSTHMRRATQSVPRKGQRRHQPSGEAQGSGVPEAALEIAKEAGFSITAEDIQSMQSTTEKGQIWSLKVQLVDLQGVGATANYARWFLAATKPRQLLDQPLQILSSIRSHSNCWVDADPVNSKPQILQDLSEILERANERLKRQSKSGLFQI